MTVLAPHAKADAGILTTSWASMGAGKCLGVRAADMTNGTPIVQWQCDGTPNQSWEIETVQNFMIPGGNWTQIRNSQDPSKCLGVQAAATNDGANLVIWDCNSSWDQQWTFVQDVAPTRGIPSGCFNIENANAFPKVIGIFAASGADGAQAVIWDNLGSTHPDQTFCPTSS
jgi:hypothetical protein